MAEKRSVAGINAPGVTLSAVLLLLAGNVAAQMTAGSGASSSPRAGTSSWDITLGAGVAVAPKYEGARDFRVLPMPAIGITWRDRVFLNTENGLGFYALKSDAFTLGASVTYGWGRREKYDRRHLRGLGNVNAAVQGRMFASYTLDAFTLHTSLGRDFGGSDGLVGTVGVTATLPVSQRFAMWADIAATWADDNHMKTFFGVTPTQSARSGLSRFKASAGFKRTDFAVGATWKFTDHWSLNATAGAGYLLGDAAHSPITRRRLQPFSALSLGYTF